MRIAFRRRMGAGAKGDRGSPPDWRISVAVRRLCWRIGCSSFAGEASVGGGVGGGAYSGVPRPVGGTDPSSRGWECALSAVAGPPPFEFAIALANGASVAVFEAGGLLELRAPGREEDEVFLDEDGWDASPASTDAAAAAALASAAS